MTDPGRNEVAARAAWETANPATMENGWTEVERQVWTDAITAALEVFDKDARVPSGGEQGRQGGMIGTMRDPYSTAADPGRSGGEGTGWHIHASGISAMRDGYPACKGEKGTTPVILLDPVTARDTIARALAASSMTPYVDGKGGWLFRAATDQEQADAVLAALASQERGE